ncbi:MAG: hypothetical protein ACREH4_04290, partial [Vitreimonas sp.]
GQAVAENTTVSPATTAQTQLEAAFVGRATPPDPEGFTSEGGSLDGDAIGVGAIWVVYGRWTHAGGEQWVTYAQRTTGTEPTGDRGHLPAEIVSVLPIPTPQAGEAIFTEYCSHPDYPEPASRIFAIASTAQARPGLTDPPSAAWRLDRATARLLQVDDATRVSCGFDHME